jgi:hypothetical protein
MWGNCVLGSFLRIWVELAFIFLENVLYSILYIVTDLLKAFLGNRSVNTVNAQQWETCLSGRMLLHVATQQRTNKDAG